MNKRRQAVEQEVSYARLTGRRRQPARSLRHLRHTRSPGPTGEYRGGERLQKRLPRECVVERLEPARRGEQQRQSLAAVPGGERDLGAQQVNHRAWQRVERCLLGGAEQDERPVEAAGAQHHLRRGQSAHPASAQIGCQGRRPL